MSLELLDLGAVRKVLGTSENTPEMQHLLAISAQGLQSQKPHKITSILFTGKV